MEKTRALIYGYLSIIWRVISLIATLMNKENWEKVIQQLILVVLVLNWLTKSLNKINITCHTMMNMEQIIILLIPPFITFHCIHIHGCILDKIKPESRSISFYTIYTRDQQVSKILAISKDTKTNSMMRLKLLVLVIQMIAKI